MKKIKKKYKQIRIKRFVTSTDEINFPFRLGAFDKDLRKILRKFIITGVEISQSKNSFNNIIAFNLCEKQQRKD